jgi:hypothetical protein
VRASRVERKDSGGNDELARTVLNRPSAAMTLDRYADLFDTDLDDTDLFDADLDDDVDDVADLLDALRAAARGQVGDLVRTASAHRRAEDPCVIEGTQATRPVHGVETRGIEPLTPALQNRPRGGLARWAMNEKGG